MIADPQKLKDTLREIALHFGVSGYEAEVLADSTVFAELRGLSSHGVVRYPSYMERIRQGLYATGVTACITRDEGAVVHLDGQNGLGAPLAMQAMELAMDRARKYGISLVGVNHGNHFGCGAYYTKYAAQHGMIALCMANANSWVTPFGGNKKKLGTNPLSFAIPAGDREPFVADMATSEAAQGKVLIAAKKGDSVPSTWGVDSSGAPTTDPDAILNGGSLLPFGGPKGYSICLAIEILCHALAGGEISTEMGSMFATDKLAGTGFLMCAIDVSRMVDPDEFARRVKAEFDNMKDAGTPQHEVMIPGELSDRRAEALSRDGITIPDVVYADLEKLADACGVSLALDR